MRGKKEGLYIGFFTGILLDIFSGSVIGINALIYMYIGYLNGYFRKMFYPEDIKLPMLLIKSFLDSGMAVPVSGNKALENIDFKQVFDLVEQGVIGELVNVESSDGDTVRIVVE